MKAILTCLFLFILLSAEDCNRRHVNHGNAHDSISTPGPKDSVIIRDSVVIRDSLIIHDSIAINDTLRIYEIGGGNLFIFGTTGSSQHTTFSIDLDSIRVTIRNDSIIDTWLRPETSE